MKRTKAVKNPEIAALRAEGHRLWELKYTRNKQALMLQISGGVLWIAWGFFGSMLPEMPFEVFLWIGVVLILAGMALFIDGQRAGFKAGRIDDKMRALDPEARLLSSWPEEFGRDIRAALDKRRG